MSSSRSAAGVSDVSVKTPERRLRLASEITKARWIRGRAGGTEMTVSCSDAKGERNGMEGENSLQLHVRTTIETPSRLENPRFPR